MERVTYLKLRQSTVSLLIKIVGLTLFLLFFWWVKGAFFGWLGDLTSIEFFYTIASVGFLFWVSLIFYGFVVIGVVVKWLSVTYEVFTDRIAIKTGLIAKKARIVSMSDFSQFTVDQGLWGRLFGYGTIEFMYRTIGPTGGYGETFYNIHDPSKLGDELRSLLQMADTQGKSSTIKSKENVDEKHRRDAEAVTVAVQENAEEGNIADVDQDEALVGALQASANEVDDDVIDGNSLEENDVISGEIQF